MDNLFGAGDLGMIYGPPGSGKTFVVIDLIFSACLGKQFANRFDVARPLNVVYCAEEGLSGLPARFQAAAEYYGDWELPNFLHSEQVPQLFDIHSGLSLYHFTQQWQETQEKPLDLLVIDTLHSAIVGADENSSKDMNQVIASAKHAASTLNCAVLLVHHSNKAGTGERGSSALRGAMDFILEVKPQGEKYSMDCAKLKDGQQWPKQTFDLVAKANSVRVWWDGPEAETQQQQKRSESVTQIKTILADYPNQRFTAKHLHEAIGGSKMSIDKLLPRMVEKGEIKRTLQDPTRTASSRNPWVYYVERIVTM